MQKSYLGQKILVIGLGLSGRAAAAFLLKRGAIVTGADRDQNLLAQNGEIEALRLQGLRALHESEPLDMRDFDLVVVSPGVPQTQVLYAAALAAGVIIIGEVELACRHLTQRSLGITGSNGKTTTTLLVAHVLNQSGRRARAIGNIGIPMTAAIDAESDGARDILVIELSSWQLETLHRPVLDAGAILNITPNHLDRHRTMEAYAAAKMNLRDCLKPQAPLFMGRRCFEEFASFPALTFGESDRCAIYSDGESLFFEGKRLFFLPAEFRGSVTHDVENILAAFALCQVMGVSGEEFLSALATFRKPPHRIEFVKKIKGVAYYDDSKGTNIDAVVKAVTALKGPIHLIAGGVHKGASYAPWLTPFEGRICSIYAMGQAAEQMKQDLGARLPVELFPSMEAALACAASRAKPGENVLLSPGCASYDMFRDYNHRGDEFKRLVYDLELELKHKN